MEQSKKIQDEIDNMIQKGCSKEEIANKVIEMRNQDKITARAKMKLDELEGIESRNVERYGNSVGPDAQWLFENKKLQLSKKGIELEEDEIWKLVIEGSMRKNGVINTLIGIKY